MKKKWYILAFIIAIVIVFAGVYPMFSSSKSDKTSSNTLKL